MRKESLLLKPQYLHVKHNTVLSLMYSWNPYTSKTTSRPIFSMTARFTHLRQEKKARLTYLFTFPNRQSYLGVNKTDESMS